MLRTEMVRQALPVSELKAPGMPELTFQKNGRIYYFGDSLSNPSINFALKSGRCAGLVVIQGNFNT